MNKKEGIMLCESELKVMELLWEEGELRAGEIVPILSARVGWNRNTTYTIIKKCVEKGAIRRIEPKFVCQPLVTKEQTQVYEINALAERLYDGTLVKNLIVRFPQKWYTVYKYLRTETTSFLTGKLP